MEVTMFVWMFLVLKIPLVLLLVLVWHALKEPEPLPEAGDDGGSRRPDPHRGPRVPRPPRRGPHAGAPPPAPDRVRTTIATRSASEH